MEKFIYLILPVFLFINFFINDNDKNIDIIIKGAKLCLVINLICLIVTKYIFDETFINNDILFIIKYCCLSIVVGFVLSIVYKALKNSVSVRMEVVCNEEVKNKNEKKKTNKITKVKK